MGAVVKVDRKGRVVIPKRIREMTELKEGSYVRVTAKGKGIVIEPLGFVATFIAFRRLPFLPCT